MPLGWWRRGADLTNERHRTGQRQRELDRLVGVASKAQHGSERARSCRLLLVLTHARCKAAKRRDVSGPRPRRCTIGMTSLRVSAEERWLDQTRDDCVDAEYRLQPRAPATQCLQQCHSDRPVFNSGTRALNHSRCHALVGRHVLSAEPDQCTRGTDSVTVALALRATEHEQRRRPRRLRQAQPRCIVR